MAADLLRWSRRALLLSGLTTATLGMGARMARAVPERAGADRKAPRWAVDYGARSDPALARQYDILVLEPDHARPIEPLRGPGSILLGYVSLGEVEKSRPYFADLLKKGALTEPNPNWPDARMADLRHPAWRETLLGTVIPDILALGYNGIFIDTTDNAEAMEHADPVRKKGMVDAAAALILAIRDRFPAIRIMLNRGYAALPRVVPAIDYLLGEAMASRWNFAKSRYELLSDDDWNWQATRLRDARAANPALLVMTLDYWEPQDVRQVGALYTRERAAGFLPYVSILALDRLVAEPVVGMGG
ncbi:endo alpha-1,4 polygalactosaminidase [Sphingobium sufflavum]|uniref:endo alpha-1,4 polygalactosaminidase n=1 Tax=Sphingobium sufflavum TaxID=1129547 RepID=UPI001F1CD672|nr:endo alpha-1,4 polygalactosaminidase [Sphingobium sufflavum]MCE7796312.1 endo alpha-1,4 polygalactosaminidase [Sphingobium sufflavum]